MIGERSLLKHPFYQTWAHGVLKRLPNYDTIRKIDKLRKESSCQMAFMNAKKVEGKSTSDSKDSAKNMY